MRSQLEHCSIIWKPVTLTQLQKFEVVQKNAVKWILNNEECYSYSGDEIYFRRYRQVNVLPVDKRLDSRDFVSFYKIVYGYTSSKLPAYVQKFKGVS